MYGNGVANIDINESIRCHENAGKMCTLTAVHPAGRYGALSLDEAGRIHTFSEKPQVEEAYISGGFMVVITGSSGISSAVQRLCSSVNRSLIWYVMASEFVPTQRFLAVDGYRPGSAILEPALADRRRAWKVWSDTATTKASLPNITFKAKK